MSIYHVSSDSANSISRQIRPPIYSLKQTKLRKRRVIRYAILYFVLLVVFLVLIIGPVVVPKFITIPSISIPMELVQPVGFNNNNTAATTTGPCLNNMNCPVFGGGSAQATGGGGGGGTNNNNGGGLDQTDNTNKFRRYMAY